MAYVHPNLHRMGPANSNAPVLWMYSTADTIADVNTEDYFIDAIDDLQVNDVLIIASSTGGTPVLTINYVNQNDGTIIDITDGLVITATDSD